jgi:hypothetical protein
MGNGPVACGTVRHDARRNQIDEALFHLSLTHPRNNAWRYYANQLLDLRTTMSRKYNLEEIQEAFKQITGDPSSGTTKELIDAIVAQLDASDEEQRVITSDRREATTLH